MLKKFYTFNLEIYYVIQYKERLHIIFHAWQAFFMIPYDNN